MKLDADYTVVGGGIVGLSTAFQLAESRPRAKVVVLEKEASIAAHQTGHNSGVIHSGLYYKPGSFKARFARAGRDSMMRFCEQHQIAHDPCGKLVVATESSELEELERLYRRGLENHLVVKKLGPEQAREFEPHVRALAALHVSSTGICDYRSVCEKYVDLLRASGGELQLSTRVGAFYHRDGGTILETNHGNVHRTRFVVNCAGLYSDRVATAAGVATSAQIVPFRGEYFELVPGKRHLVKNLIYPVPNPAFPFLGVHFTRMIDGSVHAGPNAVLAFAREGYEKSDVNLAEFVETLSYGGFWRLAKKHWRHGANEMWRSLSKAAFVRSLQSLIPEVQPEDIVPTHAGIRAQALMSDGAFVDDFLVREGSHSLHVVNAPSPGATASLEIGRYIADRVPELDG
jgi:(S)-2-hydroxyglutarate dehydrogenase